MCIRETKNATGFLNVNVLYMVLKHLFFICLMCDYCYAFFGLILSENAAHANAVRQMDMATTPFVYSFGTVMAFSLIMSGICNKATVAMR